MPEILSSAYQGMQNVYTPLSAKAHFVFCLIATVVYLLQFYRRGSWHYLVIMAAVDVTFVTQTSICRTSGAIAVLGAVEFVLLAFAAVLSIRFSRSQKAAAAVQAEEQARLDEEKERRQTAEKLQRSKDKKIVDNAFDDGEE